MSIPADEQFRILSSGAAEIIPEDEFRAQLASGRPLRVKLGLDPTAAHVTLGWAVVLRRLRRFQDMGHIAVLIVGDFTARIGDPSGQNKTRPMLDGSQVAAYAENVLGQFRLILDPSRLEVRYNSEWLGALDVPGLLRLAAHYTLAQMLQRDDFANRYAAHAPISVTEFLYPLMQAYDSVAVEADVELGGTDQYFNLLCGRDIQRAYGQDPQTVMTMPLLEGTDGVKKMSQSLGNYIGIAEPPEEMFGKLMRIPDGLMSKYFTLTTDLDPAEVAAIDAALASGQLRPEEAKRRLAAEVVALYHGRGAAESARERFDRLFRDHRLPDADDIPEVEAPGDPVDVAALLRTHGLTTSASEAVRLIAQNGVRVDGTPITQREVPRDQLTGRILQVGKRRFLRIR